MHTEVDALAVRAAADERAREQLIQSQQSAILKIASRVAHRFVTTSDDEWSVALYAFSRAIDAYEMEKGPFLAYAETVIRRSLIDSYRKDSRRSREVAVSPQAFDGAEDETNRTGVAYVVVQNSIRAADASLKEEIAAVAVECRAFGFGFSDLLHASPRQEKTRLACAGAIQFLLRDPQRLEQLFVTRRLPMQALISKTGISKKLLDRYRKYVIAAVIILSGDYPALSSYFTSIGKEPAL